MGRRAGGILGKPQPTPRPGGPLRGICVGKNANHLSFQGFVDATGFRTIAEQAPRPEDFPQVPPEALVAGSVTFHPPDHDVALDDHSQWWTYKAGVSWRHPEGPESSLDKRMDHPVVHVAWTDAQAFCA